SGHTEIFTLMSVDAFNEIISSEYKLQDDEFIYLMNGVSKMGDDPSTPYDNGLRFSSDAEATLYDLKEVITGTHVNHLSNLSEVFILNESQWQKSIRDLNGFEANIHFINLENWQESERAVNELTQTFKDYNAMTPGMDVEDIILEDELFRIGSRVDGYEAAKSSNGI